MERAVDDDEREPDGFAEPDEREPEDCDEDRDDEPRDPDPWGADERPRDCDWPRPRPCWRESSTVETADGVT